MHRSLFLHEEAIKSQTVHTSLCGANFIALFVAKADPRRREVVALQRSVS